jgi:chondroitin AC lyase
MQIERLEPRATPSADLLQNMVEEMLEEAPLQIAGAPYYLSKMRADGSFSDLNYAGNTDASANDLRGHGARLEVLSLAYKWNNPANQYFGDSTLKAEILQGWSYLASHGGSVTAPNWWWKAIGVPRAMGDGLVLMHGEISAAVQSQILSRYFGTVWEPWKYDGANLAYQATPAMIDGLLRGDSARIRDVVSRMTSEIFAYSGEGIARDLSFRQHIVGGKYGYQTGAYGLVFAHDTARVMRWAGGTTYAFSNAAVDEELKYVLDGMEWITRGDALDLPSQGRSITRPLSPENAPQDLNLAVHDMLTLGRRTSELSAAIDRYEQGVTPGNALVGSKSFWVSDAMANQRPQMLTTVKLLSNRTPRPETAAGENPQGFFEGDGFTMFVQDGDEFGSRGGPEIFPVWDWQRLPGTTVEHNGYIPYYDMFQTSANSTGGSSIVGSVSDGTYGLAAMDYRRSGVSVTAKKAWFFFDNEVVALGAGINDSSSAAPVYTSLNQVRLDGNVTVEDTGGRRTLALGSSTSLSGTGWIEHDGLGYVLLDPTSHTTVQAAQQSGGGTTLPVFGA